MERVLLQRASALSSGAVGAGIDAEGSSVFECL